MINYYESPHHISNVKDIGLERNKNLNRSMAQKIQIDDVITELNEICIDDFSHIKIESNG